MKIEEAKQLFNYEFIPPLSPKVIELLEWINENFMFIRSRKEICKGVGLTNDQLRAYDDEVGISFYRLQKKRVVEEMKKDIVVRRFTNKQLAEKYRFNGTDLVSKYFKQAVQLSLDQYRKKYCTGEHSPEIVSLLSKFGITTNLDDIKMDNLLLTVLRIMDEVYINGTYNAMLEKALKIKSTYISKQVKTRCGSSTQSLALARRRYQIDTYLRDTDLCFTHIALLVNMDVDDMRKDVVERHGITWKELRIKLREENENRNDHRGLS